MPRRSTVKRIDYSKFASESSTESDNDFEPIGPVQKKQKISTQKNVKEKVRQPKETDSKESRRKSRVSRNSNGEEIYERELTTVLEISKNDLQKNEDGVTIDCPGPDKYSIVLLEESEDEDILKKIKGRGDTSQETADSVVESEGSAFADTLPITNSSSSSGRTNWEKRNKKKETSPVVDVKGTNSKRYENNKKFATKNDNMTISPVRNGNNIRPTRGNKNNKNKPLESDDNDTTNMTKICPTKYINNNVTSPTRNDNRLERKENNNISSTSPTKSNTKKVSPARENKMKRSKSETTESYCTDVLKERLNKTDEGKSAPSSIKSSPMVSSKSSSMNVNQYSVLTPGRLRLGLSRNIRVSKPLHQNVNINM